MNVLFKKFRIHFSESSAINLNNGVELSTYVAPWIADIKNDYKDLTFNATKDTGLVSLN